MATVIGAEQAALYDLTSPVAGQTLCRGVTEDMIRYCHVFSPVQAGAELSAPLVFDIVTSSA